MYICSDPLRARRWRPFEIKLTEGESPFSPLLEINSEINSPIQTDGYCRGFLCSGLIKELFCVRIKNNIKQPMNSLEFKRLE